MTDKEERQHVIEILQKEKKTALHDNRWAFDYAISSIKTDLKYDLLYEGNQIDDADKTIPNNSEIPTGSTTKNNLVVDPIDRVELLRAMDTWDKFGFTTRYGLERLDKDDKGFVPYVKYDDMLKCVTGMPSVTLQEPRWIPVSEKKPDKGGEYLLWGKIDESEEEEYCFVGDYYEFEEKFGTEISNYDPKTLGFLDTEIEEYYSVVAWMPLPKPYKAESEDKAN